MMSHTSTIGGQIVEVAGSHRLMSDATGEQNEASQAITRPLSRDVQGIVDYRSVQEAPSHVRQGRRERWNYHSVIRCLFSVSVVISGTVITFLLAFLTIQFALQIENTLGSNEGLLHKCSLLTSFVVQGEGWNPHYPLPTPHRMKNMQDNGSKIDHTPNVFVIESSDFPSPKKTVPSHPTNPFITVGNDCLVSSNNFVNSSHYELLSDSPKRQPDSRVDLIATPLTSVLASTESQGNLEVLASNGTGCNSDEKTQCVSGDPSIEEVRELDYNLAARDSGLESAASSWDRTVAEVKEHAIARLQDELRRANEELKLRDEEVSRLSRIRSEVESELEELTASLFQEAHNMVREANVKQACAEKSLKESLMQVEVLTAEVVALKALVLTSTPSRPNAHLHPQIKDEESGGLFKRHRRSPSHFQLKNGRENSPPYSPAKEAKNPSFDTMDTKDMALEVDPVLHQEFLTWKQNPTTDKTDPFIARIYREDVNYCLDFCNSELSQSVRESMETGDIFIEAVSDKTKSNFPKKCALLEAVRHCHYRLRLGSNSTWHPISHMCRNRIIAVCDFLNYLRYIKRGLVKSSAHDIYWEIIRLRREMILARLGLSLSS